MAKNQEEFSLFFLGDVLNWEFENVWSEFSSGEILEDFE